MSGNRRMGAIATVLMVSACAFAFAPTAGAAVRPVNIVLTLAQGSVRADGHASVALRVTVTKVDGSALPQATVKLSTRFTSPPSYGAAILPSSVRLNGAGKGKVAVKSTRSGALIITASINTASYRAVNSIGMVAARHSIVVFVNGATTTVSCATRGQCNDLTGAFDSIHSALTAQGFTPADMATFSYAGGGVGILSRAWVPAASTCADSAKSYLTDVNSLRSMLQQIAQWNANIDFSIVGYSQGGLLAFQMIDAAKTLPYGARVVSVSTFDAPIGGVPLDTILHLEANTSTCWSLAGTSPAAKQLQLLWNTTVPTGGVGQADRAATMCSFVGVTGCPAQTNQQAVAARSPDVVVNTWGSTQDGVFNPAVCGEVGYTDATQTQSVTGAGGGLHAEGSPGPGSNCVLLSHYLAVYNHVADVAAVIKPQQS